MPDLTGSSFRTGLDMAAPGESVPVNFTVQNRGGADPGNFQVQVLLAPNNLFDGSAQVLATFTRSQLVADATGRELLVAGRLQRHGARWLGYRGLPTSACASWPTRRCPKPA